MKKERHHIAFNDDKLGRKVIAENLKKVLLNTNLNVLSISAPWGGGKTYFIENLINLIGDDSINILYNAWESDFYESPLIPLLFELFNKLENVDKKTELEEDIKWSKEFAKNIYRKTALQVGLNLGILNCSTNCVTDKDLIESEYIELKIKMKKFKNKLKKIQEKLGKKIIIFIDELDRCHPIYTIKTLEIIKHFFGINNIIFVLAVDKTQIENSVRQILGVNVGEENRYLRKFIDIDFQLPNYNSKEFIAYHLLKLKSKFEYFFYKQQYYRIEQKPNIADEFIYISDLIFNISNLLKFTLRDLEKFFIRLNLILDILCEDILLIEPILILNALAMYNINFFDDFVMKQYSSNNILELLNSTIPLWKGFFYDSFKQELASFKQHIPGNPTKFEINAFKLSKALSSINITLIEDQEKYLQDYPLKIKFIHNFNIMS